MEIVRGHQVKGVNPVRFFEVIFVGLLLGGCSRETKLSNVFSIPNGRTSVSFNPYLLESSFFINRNLLDCTTVHAKPQQNTCNIMSQNHETYARIIFPPFATNTNVMTIKLGQVDPDKMAAFTAGVAATATASPTPIKVLVVLASAIDWNSDPGMGGGWSRNPFNKNSTSGLKGNCVNPWDFLVAGTCQQDFFRYITQIVTELAPLRNVVAWEILGEANNLTPPPNQTVAAFDQQLAAFVDTLVTTINNATVAEVGTTIPRRMMSVTLNGGLNDEITEMPRTLGHPLLDFNSIHPYAFRWTVPDADIGDLDLQILNTVPAWLAKFKKPVVISESGLGLSGTSSGALTATRAFTGLQHAIWAALVSGAANGRSFWDPDGLDDAIGENPTLSTQTRYQQIAAPVLAFTNGVNFSNLVPLPVTLKPDLVGGVIGTSQGILSDPTSSPILLGWFRDSQCRCGHNLNTDLCDVNWPPRLITNPSSVVVNIAPGNTNAQWKVEYFSTTAATGVALPVGSYTPTATATSLSIPLPPFTQSIAFKVTRISSGN